GLINPLAIIHFTVGDIDEMVQRMKRRAEKEGRHDDADENVIRNRFDVYRKETEPVLGHFDPGLVIEVDAIGTIEEVHERVKAAVTPIYEQAFDRA
ncbi:MAG: nucleoside monophosphate kinase, partial [Planctomycetota bacterium]|nr:nucleoside monophosphate kinase [Planctomycetota bacterium]